MLVDTTHRSNEPELMDDFSMKGEMLRDTLKKLGSINKWLGGNAVTLGGLRHLLKYHTKDKTCTIIDVGCGHGEMLRLIADYGRKHHYSFRLIGLDANPDAIDFAIELSRDYEELTFKHLDVFSEEFKSLQYDIVLSTLFLHHLSQDQIHALLKILTAKAKIGIVINDLHRNRIAYILFSVLGLLISNKVIVSDGLTSILRAFKRQELEHMARQLDLKSQIHWKWAFRYQWLIKS